MMNFEKCLKVVSEEWKEELDIKVTAAGYRSKGYIYYGESHFDEHCKGDRFHYTTLLMGDKVLQGIEFTLWSCGSNYYIKWKEV